MPKEKLDDVPSVITEPATSGSRTLPRTTERQRAAGHALVRSGELPAIKIGGRGVWRVDKGRLDTHLECLEQETAT